MYIYIYIFFFFIQYIHLSLYLAKNPIFAFLMWLIVTQGLSLSPAGAGCPRSRGDTAPLPPTWGVPCIADACSIGWVLINLRMFWYYNFWHPKNVCLDMVHLIYPYPLLSISVKRLAFKYHLDPFSAPAKSNRSQWVPVTSAVYSASPLFLFWGTAFLKNVLNLAYPVISWHLNQSCPIPVHLHPPYPCAARVHWLHKSLPELWLYDDSHRYSNQRLGSSSAQLAFATTIVR